MHARRMLALAVSAAALAAWAAAAGPASAATLTPAVACQAGGNSVAVTGTGFTPNATVDISGSAGSGSFETDATGTFVASVLAPTVTDFVAHTVTLVATDGQNAALTARASFGVVRDLFATNFPINGRPAGRVRWQFAGFVPGKPIYGHFRHHRRTRANYRFGLATGPCGTLSVMARRLPTKSRPGTWTVQFDQAKSYNRFTKPRRTASFTIVRTFS